MSAIWGPVTPGRIAFALGSIGVGALVGAAWADHNEGDVGRGALYGGAAAVAGLALLAGGAYAWNRFGAARAGASAGASQLGATLSHVTTPAAHTATATAPTVTTLMRLPAPSTLFHATQPALATSVPVIARTPVLPVATSSGGTFVDALRAFIR